MEGKESQKDILRLRQLEQAKHENGSSSTATDEQRFNDHIAQVLGNENSLNGFSPGLAIRNENN